MIPSPQCFVPLVQGITVAAYSLPVRCSHVQEDATSLIFPSHWHTTAPIGMWHSCCNRY